MTEGGRAGLPGVGRRQAVPRGTGLTGKWHGGEMRKAEPQAAVKGLPEAKSRCFVA